MFIYFVSTLEGVPNYNDLLQKHDGIQKYPKARTATCSCPCLKAIQSPTQKYE